MRRNFLKYFYPEDPDSVQFNFYFKSIEAWLKSVFGIIDLKTWTKWWS